MAWTLEYEPLARKQLKSLDKPVRERIARFLDERVAPLENPRAIGEPLNGEKMGLYWRYRVGDYRIVVHIENTRIVVRVVQIGHRRDIYRKF